MKTKQFAIATLALCLFSILPDQARAFYNPQAGHWLSRDPIEEQGGLNINAFAKNNPVGIVDALGLASVPMPPNPAPNACCQAILDFLKQLARHVRGRYNDLLADKQFLYKYNRVGWQNHIDKLEEQQTRLNKWIDKFNQLCPGGGGGSPMPHWIPMEADRPAPVQPLWAERNGWAWANFVPGSPQALQAAGYAAAGVGAAAIAASGVGLAIEAGVGAIATGTAGAVAEATAEAAAAEGTGTGLGWAPSFAY